MQALLIRYETTPLPARLLLAMSAVVLINGLYCLAYRYTSGNPATVGEALGWGIVNLAPWVAAIEIGRRSSSRRAALRVVLAAGLASLALGIAYGGSWPDSFEIVRRLPGVAATLLILGGLALRRRRIAVDSLPKNRSAPTFECDWVRAAGNYVEVHRRGLRPILMRGTVSSLAGDREARLVRIHRSYAVSRDAVAKVERTHIRLRDGTRLPIGDAFRPVLGES